MKFSHDDEAAVKQFVTDGYVVYKDVFDPDLVSAGRSFIEHHHNGFMDRVKKGELELDVNGWGVAIIQAFEKTNTYEKLIKSPKLASLLKKYLGPDVALINNPGMFINAAGDTSAVTKKPWHTDVWTGSGVDTPFAILMFTDIDEYNGLSVWPGSHLQGLFPVRNRKVDPSCGVTMDGVDIKTSQGDLILWHPLIIHATTGRSPSNTRISITFRFTDPNNLTSQERNLGYRPISVGPLNQIRRVIGNDYLQPFRTLGGFVGIDRTMAEIYNYTPFKDSPDYSVYMEDA